MDDTGTAAVTSELDDLAQTPLADLDGTAGEAMAGTLRRIVPAAQGQRVTVAAFNSSV